MLATTGEQRDLSGEARRPRIDADTCEHGSGERMNLAGTVDWLLSVA